ncbi:hypothetical protein H5410_062530 [Solanum commersonii]|uniref:Uncharacterized protein n=1 Tax=Solanum commersonii TaxID=4109 RepID=A0A9J5WBT6_SOLCO|nr:hypothetical protein H5410_062530 [Solanum commersonii]
MLMYATICKSVNNIDVTISQDDYCSDLPANQEDVKSKKTLRNPQELFPIVNLLMESLLGLVTLKKA